MRRIHTNQREVYKVGLSAGLILRNRESGEFRYFHASQNNMQLTNSNFSRTNSLVLERTLISFMVTCDIVEETKRLVDKDTKWKVVCVTNVNVAVYKSSSDYPIGSVPVIL
jgi:hypothetical protein